VVPGSLDTGIEGSNRFQGICPNIYVLSCLVDVKVFYRADPLHRESYHIPNAFIILEIILIWNASQDLVRRTDDDHHDYY
jgi:hypothetical protein